MIRIREGDQESILTIDEFERRARRGELSPFADVCIPALTGERFVQARELPLFAALYDPRRILFRRHFHLGRYPVLTGVVALVCIALFLWARHSGDGVVTREALLELGAKARARIVDEGELWRLLVANLLHRDVTHLAFNLFALLNIGAVLEGVYRRGDYLLLLVVGGVSTMVVSTFASGPVTVGASGMVFACLGAGVVFGLRFSDLLPTRYRIYFGVVVVGYAATMFYLGLQRATTDNWGHGGGLLAGLVMGGVLVPRLMRLRDATEPRAVAMRPWIACTVVVVALVALGPLLPRLLLSFRPYRLDSFGIVIERPSTWTKGPDPLGFIAFGNGVDALASIACDRGARRVRLDDAAAGFVDRELTSLARAGHISNLTVGAPLSDVVGTAPGTVPARRVAFSFIASDGPFEARAWVFVRGDTECAFVLAHRTSATARSKELLEEVRARVRLVERKTQRDAANAALNRPTSVKAQLDLALAHQAAGDLLAARRAFDAAREAMANERGWEGRVPVARAQLELEAFAYDGTGDLDVALAAAAEARAAKPDDADVALLLADVLLARMEPERARIALASARKQFPNDTRLQAREAALTTPPGAP
ncbi:MAG: rhomboid family intramembrane serine protease [Deltaproteobacteria bacterium]|nr:rhomboid family intramembrane serine protease [Deltaproteobacteria bacterium]